MAVTFDHSTFTAAQSSTGVFAASSFIGANTLSGVAPVTINGTVDTPGSVVQVSLNIAGVTSAGAQGTYLGYTAVPSASSDIYYFSVTGADLVTPVTIAVTGSAALPPLSVATAVTTANVTAPVSVLPTCFAPGTHIRTARGDVAVEHLKVGDLAVTATGAERPIVWIGRRRTDCAAHFNPVEVLPIRILAGAFGTNLPLRDLVVSPGHRMFVNGGLITADRLVNGWSIVREWVDEITYWHVELETHDVLLAEGLPAESYLDCGNRIGFDNSGAVVLMQADLDALAQEEGRCAPMIPEGPELAAVKEWLIVRARSFGARFTADPGIACSVDGLALTPASVVDGRFTFHLPEDGGRLTLASRASPPAEVRPETDDRRRLGVFVHDLVIDGVPVSLENFPAADGWHVVETHGCGTGRWTSGSVQLPAGRSVAFSVEAMPVYGVDHPQPIRRSDARAERRLRAVG